MRTALEILTARPVRVVLSVVLTGLLGALLVATIHFTRVDLQWIAFLGGVLFAAVVAMASQASRAEWRVARRTKQLERARAQLGEEIARSRNTAEALRIADARLRLLSDALPTLILYVDRNERCRHHNRAVERKTGFPAERIEGQPLREVVGNDVYLNIAPHIAKALSGVAVDYELAWDTPTSPDPVYTARHVPYPPGSAQPLGFYLLLTRAPLQTGAQAADAGSKRGTISDEGGESFYLRSITDELTGWDDPRAELARALEGNQFLLFAQKIEPLGRSSPDPLCFEILLRLREEEDNFLPPGGFLPVAEHYGMMEELDRWVVRNLVSRCAQKRREDPAWPIPLYCVNLSEAAVTSSRFARFVSAELERSHFPARSLCFEIGEQDIINHHAAAQRLMAALKPAGCRFTVDAFGSVKVSFSHLKGLAIDFIKIDGAIIQNILRNPAELAKAKAISAVCRKIGVRTIAEFVESEETLEKLRAIGVDYAQGFGIARPGPIGNES